MSGVSDLLWNAVVAHSEVFGLLQFVQGFKSHSCCPSQQHPVQQHSEQDFAAQRTPQQKGALTRKQVDSGSCTLFASGRPACCVQVGCPVVWDPAHGVQQEAGAVRSVVGAGFRLVAAGDRLVSPWSPPLFHSQEAQEQHYGTESWWWGFSNANFLLSLAFLFPGDSEHLWEGPWLCSRAVRCGRPAGLPERALYST